MSTISNGDPKPQTIATEKYAKKVGLISKSYKLKKELVEEFANACGKVNISQAMQLSNMMKGFVMKADVEKEYASRHDVYLNLLSSIDSIIGELKEELQMLEDEKEKIAIEEELSKAYKMKKEAMQMNMNYYERFNVLYKKAK